MVSQISVVINTFNEEKNIKKTIESLNWAEEIVVVDDGSTDRTYEIIAKLKREKPNLRIFRHRSAGYVEPARNFAISKASNEWILILDADEVLPESLVKRLAEITAEMKRIDFVRIPRKNLIFGYWMQASMWWPDYNVRFFKKGKVTWLNKIHRPPETTGESLDLPAEEKYAIIHQNYVTISQFLARMDRYTTIQARELKQEGYKFEWKDLFEKPLSEFLSRFFANSGYKDGIHGLALSFLQAYSFLVVYLKLWEIDKFRKEDIDLLNLENQKNRSAEAINYWMKKTGHQGNFFKKFFGKKD